MIKFFHLVKRITLFYITLKNILPCIWKITMWDFIHWHLAYGQDAEDYHIIWTELHKAHKIYATKLNFKYGKPLWNAGLDHKKPSSVN